MPEAAKILRWGLLSTARINRALFAPLAQSKRSRLVGVASRDPSRAGQYAARHAIPRAYGSYQAMLDDPEIDVIYNPLPNHLHAEWTIRALQAGKHVLLEKPFVLTAAEMDAVEQAARRAGRVVAEGFMYRHHPQTRKVEQLVRQGAIGELKMIQGAFTHNSLAPGDFRWKPEEGGGAAWDVGCYPVSYMRMLTGSAPRDVSASQVNAPSGVDLTLLGQLRFAGDVTGQFYCSFGMPLYMRMELRGTLGSLVIPEAFIIRGKDALPMILTRGDVVEKIPVPDQDLYLGEVQDLERAVLEGAAPLISLAESRDNLLTLLALLESARSGRSVAL